MSAPAARQGAVVTLRIPQADAHAIMSEPRLQATAADVGALHGARARTHPGAA